MTFRSAANDLRGTTLAALPSPLARLAYLAALRDAKGEYGHWGLAKVYGAEEAQRVLRAAHQEALDAVLRQSLAELYAEAEKAPAMFEREAKELLPPPSGGLREAHFSLVWDALRAVARRRSSRRPAA
jgi:hypothetical protein